MSASLIVCGVLILGIIALVWGLNRIHGSNANSWEFFGVLLVCFGLWCVLFCVPDAIIIPRSVFLTTKSSGVLQPPTSLTIEPSGTVKWTLTGSSPSWVVVNLETANHDPDIPPSLVLAGNVVETTIPLDWREKITEISVFYGTMDAPSAELKKKNPFKVP